MSCRSFHREQRACNPPMQLASDVFLPATAQEELWAPTRESIIFSYVRENISPSSPSIPKWSNGKANVTDPILSPNCLTLLYIYFFNFRTKSKSLYMWSASLLVFPTLNTILQVRPTQMQQLNSSKHISSKKKKKSPTRSFFLLRMRSLKATKGVVLSFSPLLCDNSITFSLHSTIQWICNKRKEMVLP